MKPRNFEQALRNARSDKGDIRRAEEHGVLPKAAPAGPFWTLSYLVSGDPTDRRYCAPVSVLRDGRQMSVRAPLAARRFASRAEAVKSIPDYSGWIIANIEPFLVGEEPASPPKQRALGQIAFESVFPGTWSAMSPSAQQSWERAAARVCEETARQRDALAAKVATMEQHEREWGDLMTRAHDAEDSLRLRDMDCQRVKKQRDELLAACKKITELPAHPMRKKGVEIALAAIARCQPAEKGVA